MCRRNKCYLNYQLLYTFNFIYVYKLMKVTEYTSDAMITTLPTERILAILATNGLFLSVLQ